MSTRDQNLELQREALNSAGCDHTFEDRESGAKAARPGLDEALSIMRPGDTLVIWKLSRLSRNIKPLIETVQDRGIELRSLNESIETATGKLLFHIAASFAEFERDNMIENTAAGLVSARAKNGGRPAARVRSYEHPALLMDGIRRKENARNRRNMGRDRAP